MATVIDEVIDFIASGPSASAVADWRPSEQAQSRLEELLVDERSGRLTQDDAEDLRHYMEIEHIMRLAKARARQRIGGE